jgi:ComF family protein
VKIGANQSLRRLGVALLDALLPPFCLTCDAAVDSQGALCAGCWRGLHLLSSPLCRVCGVPFLHAGQASADGLCLACLERLPAYGAARAALRYDDGARRLLLPFKHGDRTEFASPLARLMARSGTEMLARADVLAPVPLHWRRLMARRYNQAALLAGRLASASGRLMIPDLLRRTRPTPSLGDKGAEERARILEGAFAIAPQKARQIVGRRVLLVDDVMTSGATAEACTAVLLAAGAAGVDVLAAARVPDPRLEHRP